MKRDFQSCVYVKKEKKKKRGNMCVPVQRRYAVNGLEAATRRHHIEAVSAVTGDVEVVFGVAVLHHHDEPCPAVGQVVARHSLTALRKDTIPHSCWLHSKIQYTMCSVATTGHPWRRSEKVRLLKSTTILQSGHSCQRFAATIIRIIVEWRDSARHALEQNGASFTQTFPDASAELEKHSIWWRWTHFKF